MNDGERRSSRGVRARQLILRLLVQCTVAMVARAATAATTTIATTALATVTSTATTATTIVSTERYGSIVNIEECGLVENVI